MVTVIGYLFPFSSLLGVSQKNKNKKKGGCDNIVLCDMSQPGGVSTLQLHFP